MFPKILIALRAFPILDRTSSPVPPLTLMILPKYVNDVTSSMSWSLIVIRSIDLLSIFMILVFSVLMLSPTLDETASSFEVFFCI